MHIIQKLSIKNLNELENLYIQQFKDEAWTKEQIKSAFMNNSISYYGIFQNEELISFACIMITLDDINLLDIATKDGYKNKGYAKEMLKFLIGLKNDEQTFSLEVKSKNLPAINLYNSFGLKTLNIRKKYYKDGDDALCMFLK